MPTDAGGTRRGATAQVLVSETAHGTAHVPGQPGRILAFRSGLRGKQCVRYVMAWVIVSRAAAATGMKMYHAALAPAANG